MGSASCASRRPQRSDRDPHLSRDQVERFGLRAGDRVAAMARAPRRSERNPSVVEILEVNGQPASEDPERPEDFSELAALPPAERLPMSNSSAGLRMLEVVTPLGKGQRALVEGPGGAGATRLLHDIASSLSETPVHVVAAVIDARPEELWAWQSSGSELFATTAEDAPADQVRGAVLALERSKRLVEEGSEVVLIVDSLTRLARAHGLAGTRGGTEGDSAVHEAKRLFAAARRTDRGSLTIVAAARSDGTAAADDGAERGPGPDRERRAAARRGAGRRRPVPCDRRGQLTHTRRGRPDRPRRARPARRPARPRASARGRGSLALPRRAAGGAA